MRFERSGRLLALGLLHLVKGSQTAADHFGAPGQQGTLLATDAVEAREGLVETALSLEQGLPLGTKRLFSIQLLTLEALGLAHNPGDCAD